MATTVQATKDTLATKNHDHCKRHYSNLKVNTTAMTKNSRWKLLTRTCMPPSAAPAAAQCKA